MYNRSYALNINAKTTAKNGGTGTLSASSGDNTRHNFHIYIHSLPHVPVLCKFVYPFYGLNFLKVCQIYVGLRVFLFMKGTFMLFTSHDLRLDYGSS